MSHHSAIKRANKYIKASSKRHPNTKHHKASQSTFKAQNSKDQRTTNAPLQHHQSTTKASK
jgi:hypothetical protein